MELETRKTSFAVHFGPYQVSKILARCVTVDFQIGFAGAGELTRVACKGAQAEMDLSGWRGGEANDGETRVQNKESNNDFTHVQKRIRVLQSIGSGHKEDM